MLSFLAFLAIDALVLDAFDSHKFLDAAGSFMSSHSMIAMLKPFQMMPLIKASA